MTSVRVFQISDTHLSDHKPFFVANWQAFANHAAQDRPDLIVNTGDIALDGHARPADLAFARTLHDALPAPVLCLPGNHDIGDNPAGSHLPRQPIGAAPLATYRERFGADSWCHDVGDWRFIGLNAQLFASGLADEAAQWAALEAALAGAGGRPVAIWLHKPLFNGAPDETDEAAHRYVPPATRDRLLAAFAAARVRLVASGHTHQHRETHHGGIAHVWCPSSAFILRSERLQPRIGTKTVGFVEYVFEGESVSIALRRADGMIDLDIAEFPDSYGELSAKIAALAADD